MTPAQVQRLIVAMTTALPKDWSFLSSAQQKATEATYHRMLADLPYDAARAGVEALLATATRMPLIAEIREATLAAMHGELRAGVDAWGDVRALRSYRDREATDGIDPLVLQACRTMGWIRTRELSRGGVDVEQWCITAGENESADRAQFIKLYDHLATGFRREQNISALPATRAYRALVSGTASGSAVPQLNATNARSEQQAPHRADFHKLLPEGSE